jgi:hypothetical protein
LTTVQGTINIMTLFYYVEGSLKCMLFKKFQMKLASEIHHEILCLFEGCS